MSPPRMPGIIAVATQLYLQGGYEKVTMAAVASAAGLSEGTLYNYFRDKQDLQLRVSLNAFEGHTQAAERAVAARRAGHQVVMVVSARGHKTDELIELAREVAKSPPPREMDMLLSTGEQESVALMAMAIHGLGERAVSLTGAQIGIETDSTFTKARIRRISSERMRRALDAAGFKDAPVAP